ncbi:hypothetical protein BDD12DRAFT_21341 [Trichophaea hybrida]|nr:hypothetical protein BDD12DRAFT_21341 [Trichophaea hybrida]
MDHSICPSSDEYTFAPLIPYPSLSADSSAPRPPSLQRISNRNYTRCNSPYRRLRECTQTAHLTPLCSFASSSLTPYCNKPPHRNPSDTKHLIDDPRNDSMRRQMCPGYGCGCRGKYWVSEATHKSTVLQRKDAYTPARESFANNGDSAYFDEYLTTSVYENGDDGKEKLGRILIVARACFVSLFMYDNPPGKSLCIIILSAMLRTHKFMKSQIMDIWI